MLNRPVILESDYSKSVLDPRLPVSCDRNSHCSSINQKMIWRDHIGLFIIDSGYGLEDVDILFSSTPVKALTQA